MLERAGYEFEVMAADIDEKAIRREKNSATNLRLGVKRGQKEQFFYLIALFYSKKTRAYIAKMPIAIEMSWSIVALPPRCF